VPRTDGQADRELERHDDQNGWCRFEAGFESFLPRGFGIGSWVGRDGAVPGRRLYTALCPMPLPRAGDEFDARAWVRPKTEPSSREKFSRSSKSGTT
jgi:hypothetical protein